MNDQIPTFEPTPTRLAMVVHLHDPGWLSDEELAKRIAMPLDRLADILTKHPAVRFTLYLPGRVLEACSRQAPRAVEALKQATVAGRVEWLGGGFHDPLFPLIPESWRRSQIQMHRQTLRNVFGFEPRGVWLPEFVWDPCLVQVLHQAGFEYTVLKDYQISTSTQETPMQGGWHITEELGVPLRIVASQEALCALFRAGALEAMLGLFSEPRANGSVPVGVLDVPLLAPTGEGFEPVHLERLSVLCEICSDKLDQWRFPLLSDLLRTTDCLGAVCPGPSASKTFCPSGPGGGVRDLLRRQGAANAFHKRMLHLVTRAEEVPAPRVRAQAAEPLLRSQNCAFYRDSDEAGGVQFLRDRIRMGQLLLEAETALEAGQGEDATRIDAFDLLCEGTQQYLAHHQKVGLLVEHRRGGRISELDFKPRTHTWGAVPAPRPVLTETFLENPDDPGDPLEAGKFDIGDFAEKPFDSQIKRTGKDLQILLSREGTLLLGGERHPLLVEKTFTLRAGKAQLSVTYKLSNPGSRLLLFGFSAQAAVSPGPWEPTHQSHRVANGQWVGLGDALHAKDTLGWEIVDRSAGVSLEWEGNKPCRLDVRSLVTPSSRSTDGWRFQGMLVFPFWEVRLAPGESWSLISRFAMGSVRRA